MFTEQKLEQHYSSLPSETLHIIRDEYKWALETCGVHSEEQIKYIEKTLSLRGESPGSQSQPQDIIPVQMWSEPYRNYRPAGRQDQDVHL